GQYGASGPRNHLMRHSCRKMSGADVALGFANTENDEVGTFLIGGFEDLVARDAVHNDCFWLVRQRKFARNKRIEAIHGAGFEFMRANEVACFWRLNDVHEDKARIIFFGESGNEGDGSWRAFAEIGGIEDLAELGLLESFRIHMRTDREHRAWCFAQNFFGDRAEEEFADAAAAVGAEDDEVGVLFFRHFVDDGNDAAIEGDDFCWD